MWNWSTKNYNFLSCCKEEKLQQEWLLTYGLQGASHKRTDEETDALVEDGVNEILIFKPPL